MNQLFRMRALRSQWCRFQQSMWFLPSTLTLGAVGLYLVSMYLDHRLGLRLSPQALPSGFSAVLFSGGPSAAQGLLTNISGMWATIVGVSFSVTLVTIQLTATKYIAQVLPLFERNRVNQLVLGAYLATVTYALLVAKTIRIEPPAFVPYISVNIALLLAVVSIFLLILFVTNTVNLVRPQFFLEQTLLDTEANLDLLRRPLEGWHVAPWRHDESAEPPAGCTTIRAPGRGLLTEMAWSELARVLRSLLAGGQPGEVWRLYLAKSVGDTVRAGEALAYMVPGPGADAQARVADAVVAACVLRHYNRPSDNVDSGIEALAGLTIKGAVQGDLDVTFAGVDGMFSLLIPLAEMPGGPMGLELKDVRPKFRVYLPASRRLAKWVREMTVVSEVALAPSLPFRLVTEGISRRFADVLIQLVRDGREDVFERILEELRAWYESAFFHVDWVHGMYHLTHDLTDVALQAHRLGAPRQVEAVLSFMRHNRDRLSSDAQAREALDSAFKVIEQETEASQPPPASGAVEDGRIL